MIVPGEARLLTKLLNPRRTGFGTTAFQARATGRNTAWSAAVLNL